MTCSQSGYSCDELRKMSIFDLHPVQRSKNVPERGLVIMETSEARKKRGSPFEGEY